MARHPRFKVPGHAAGYHIVTRTRGGDHLLEARHKEKFQSLLSRLKTLYYAEYASYTILDNHYHLLVTFKDPEEIDPAEAMSRWNTYHDKTPYKRRSDIPAHVENVISELTDISSFMKRLNYHMTTHYNKTRCGTGTLWERRYHSSIVERGPAMVMTAAYIELNAFRASLTANPEEYRYSSLHELKQRAERSGDSGLVSRSLLDEGLHTSEKEMTDLYQTYRAYIYQKGTSPHKTKPNGIIVTSEMQARLKEHGLEQTAAGILSRRIKELIRGKVTAGSMYAREFYRSHIDPGFTGEKRRRHESGWVKQLAGTIWNVCSASARAAP